MPRLDSPGREAGLGRNRKMRSSISMSSHLRQMHIRWWQAGGDSVSYTCRAPINSRTDGSYPDPDWEKEPPPPQEHGYRRPGRQSYKPFNLNDKSPEPYVVDQSQHHKNR